MSDIELMRTRLVKRNRYRKSELTGLSSKCDWFVSSGQIIKSNETSEPRSIFVSQFKSQNNLHFFYYQVLPLIKNKFILILASEDITYPLGIGDCRYKRNDNVISKGLIDHPLIIKIAIENLDLLHPKLIPIPLGIGYPNKTIDLNSIKPINFKNRNIGCFVCHKIRPNSKQWDDRKKINAYCRNEWSSLVEFHDNLPYKIFVEKLRQSKFCLCVHGGGYDPSPKCWEAILHGCIPIIQHSPLDKAYEQLPVVFVDNWTLDSISHEKLTNWLNELSSFYEDPEKRREVLIKLSLDYWWNYINQ